VRTSNRCRREGVQASACPLTVGAGDAPALCLVRFVSWPECQLAEQNTIDWRIRAFELKADHPRWGAPSITRVLKEELGEYSAPPERTVSRHLQRWDHMVPGQRALYEYLHWPESMGGSLPWDASQAVLELLNYRESLFQGRANYRPRVGHALWFLRVTLAAPGLSVQERYRIASVMHDGSDWGGDIGDRTRRKSETILRRRLAGQPWELAVRDLTEEETNGNT